MHAAGVLQNSTYSGQQILPQPAVTAGAGSERVFYTTGGTCGWLGARVCWRRPRSPPPLHTMLFGLPVHHVCAVQKRKPEKRTSVAGPPDLPTYQNVLYS
jgi:hypothetical protein